MARTIGTSAMEATMHRRTFLSTSAAIGLGAFKRIGSAAEGDAAARFPRPAPLPFRDEKSDLKITAIRSATLQPLRPLPKHTPTPGFWNTTEVEIANPL